MSLGGQMYFWHDYLYVHSTDGINCFPKSNVVCIEKIGVMIDVFHLEQSTIAVLLPLIPDEILKAILSLITIKEGWISSWGVVDFHWLNQEYLSIRVKVCTLNWRYQML